MVVIKHGTVHDGLGQVKQVDLAIEGGIIVDMRANIAASKHEVVDASGCVVLPGFVDALNVWGTVGPGWTEGDNHEGSAPITPEMNILYGFDHDGMNFQKVYTYGVTAACISPSNKNIIGGQAAVFKTVGSSPYRMLVKESNAMIASVTNQVKKAFQKREVAPMTRMGIFSMLIEALDKAEKYKPDDGYDSKHLAVQRVLSGELPLFVNCSGKAQIDAVLNALGRYPKLRLVLTGAFGLDDQFQPVLSGEVPVVLGDQTECYIPGNSKTEPDKIIAMMENPNCPAQIAISCCGDGTTSGKESLLWNALYWRRHGLSSAQALRAITSTPARILQVGDRIGCLRKGYDADLSIWSDNPLDTYKAQLRKVYVDGEDILSRQGGISCW